MKWFAVLLLALGILSTSVASLAARLQDDKKEEKKDGDKKDGDKKDGDKKDGDKKDGDTKDGDKKDGDKKDGGKDTPKLTPEQEKALKALSGTWTIVSYEREGKKSPADEIKKMKVVQNGAEWRFFVGEDITLGKDTVAPGKDPKEVDSLYINGPAREKTAKGIYMLKGDELTYCHADPGKDRPKEFKSGKEGSGITLIVLKRQKDDPIDEEKDKGKKDGDKKDGDKKDGDKKDGDKKDGDKDKKKDD